MVLGCQKATCSFTQASNALLDTQASDVTPQPKDSCLAVVEFLVGFYNQFSIDGEEETMSPLTDDRIYWADRAGERISRDGRLSRYCDILLYDWTEPDHYHWVATAPIEEILDWAQRVWRDQ